MNSDTTKNTLLECSNYLIVVLEFSTDKSTESAAVFLSDNHIVSDIDKTTSQVTRIGCLEGGISKTLTSTVSRDKVLKCRHTFLKVSLDRILDDLGSFSTCLLRLGHKTSHTRQLCNLIL